jgi:5-methylcytosine-specific restriction endonuclease McrA
MRATVRLMTLADAGWRSLPRPVRSATSAAAIRALTAAVRVATLTTSKGEHDWTNLTGACKACNASKRERPLLLWMLERRPA